MNRRKTLIRPLVVLVVSLFVGCGGDGLDRIGITGNVMHEGMPLAGAEVIFRPEFGPSSGALTDVNGNYEVDSDYGPNSGRCEIRVVKMMIPKGEQYERNVLPIEFSNEPMVVEFESGQNTLDIDLDDWKGKTVQN